MKVLPMAAYPWLFPMAMLAGGLAAAGFGLIVAIPSFKVRGDYLAMITLAFLMIVKSLIENIDAIGGPRGIPGIRKLTTLPWVFFWVVVTVWVVRNFVYSKYGRGVLSIREDEIASDLMSVEYPPGEISGVYGVLILRGHRRRACSPICCNLSVPGCSTLLRPPIC
jgi:branched-chain amino acid transport system permease protein